MPARERWIVDVISEKPEAEVAHETIYRRDGSTQHMLRVQQVGHQTTIISDERGEIHSVSVTEVEEFVEIGFEDV